MVCLLLFLHTGHESELLITRISSHSCNTASTSVYRRLCEYFKPHWFNLGLIFTLSALSIPIAILLPIPLKIAIDSALGSEPLPRALHLLVTSGIVSNPSTVIILVVVLYIALAIVSHARALAIWMLSAKTGEDMILRLRIDLYAHAHHLPLEYHDKTNTTQTLYRVYQDAMAIKHVPIDGVIPFLNSCCMFIGMVAATFLIDWQLAIVGIVVTPPLLILTRYYSKQLRAKWTEVKKIDSENATVMQEALAAYRLVKTFHTEEQEAHRFVGHAAAYASGHIGLARLGSRFDFWTSLIMACGTATVMLIGIHHIQAGSLTIGEFLIAMAYLAQMYAPLEVATKKAAELQSALSSVERAFGLLDQPKEKMTHPNGQSLAKSNGAVSFRNVSFAYDSRRPILDNISFDIPSGSRVGIIGFTGGGKSTLMSLLMRFYEPISGQVLLDGKDLREYNLSDLRQQFATVQQDTYLFSNSIAQNIAYSRPGATIEEVIFAAKAAHAHDFIMRLPDGYQTAIGEHGVRLSGGERQRIALARAFLKNSPILVLDEPTSALDISTEAVIVQAMENVMRNRTTFLIAHRLTTLKHCNIVLTLSQGSITVQHTEPLAYQNEDFVAAIPSLATSLISQ
ncbi:ABC transporter ATP-binding protein [Nitrospira sp. Nam74]